MIYIIYFEPAIYVKKKKLITCFFGLMSWWVRQLITSAAEPKWWAKVAHHFWTHQLITFKTHQNVHPSFFGYVYCWATACNDGETCKAYLNDCIGTHNVYKVTGTSVINAAIRQVLVLNKMGKLLILTKAWKSIRNAKVMHVHEKQLKKWKKVERQIWGLNSCWKLY